MADSIIVDILKTFSLIILTLVLISVIVFALAQHKVIFSNKFIKLTKGNVILFITAHPDDECMFFGPALIQATEVNPKTVHLLCLTTGNYDNKGLLRQKEMFDSCEVTGVPVSNVNILDNSSFLDGNKEWNFEELLPVLQKYIKKVKPDIVFTFDGYGVSGHCNHIDTGKAVRSLFPKARSKERIPVVYELESVSLFRKYISLIDVPISLVTGTHLILSSASSILKAQKAMFAHQSQLLWFRYLFIAFSRYIIINTFRRVI